MDNIQSYPYIAIKNMLNAWIRNTTELFASVTVEVNADTYVADHAEDLQQQIGGIICELSDPTCNDRADEFKALSPAEQLNFALCKLAMTIHSASMKSDLDTIEKLGDLRSFLSAHFHKTDVGGFLANLQSDSLRLMGAAESLGRVNLTESLTRTSLSYEALFLRIKCETLYPKFIHALYITFAPETTLLTQEQQKSAAKAQIRHYFTDNHFHEFSRVPLDYVGVTGLIGPYSVSTLFTEEDEADQLIYNGLIDLIKKHPILTALSQNSALPAQDSLEQILTYIDIFSVLTNSPYSHDRVHDPVTKKLVQIIEAKPTPETLQLIAHLSLESYQTYQNIQQQIRRNFAQHIETVTSFNPTLFHGSLSTPSLFDQYIGKTLARLFELRFSPMSDPSKMEQEYNKALTEQTLKLYSLFSSSLDIPLNQISNYLNSLCNLLQCYPEIVLAQLENKGTDGSHLGHVIASSNNIESIRLYLALLQALTDLFPERTLALLTQFRLNNEQAATDGTLSSLIDDTLAQLKYHKLIVQTVECVLATTPMKSLDKSFKKQLKEQLTQSLSLLINNIGAFPLIKQCLNRENAVGKFLFPRHSLSGSTSSIQKKFKELERAALHINNQNLVKKPSKDVYQSHHPSIKAPPTTSSQQTLHSHKQGRRKQQTVFTPDLTLAIKIGK